MMTTASLFAFFAKPQILVSAFRGLFRRQGPEARSDVLRDIELPMRVFVVGIPVVGGMVVLPGPPVLRRSGLAGGRSRSR